MTLVTSPSLQLLLPSELRIIGPEYFREPHVDSQAWVGNGSDGGQFQSQFVTCFYPMSGGYGPVPRYLYYSLICFAILWRNVDWLCRLALGTLLLYSSNASLHGIILAALSPRLAPHEIIDNY